MITQEMGKNPMTTKPANLLSAENQQAQIQNEAARLVADLGVTFRKIQEIGQRQSEEIIATFRPIADAFAAIGKNRNDPDGRPERE